MKCLIISVTVLLLFVPFALNEAVAQRQKSINQAVVDGDIDLVKSYISAGEDVNKKNRMNWTLLHTAIRNKRTQIITFLLEKGADINAKENRGRTPLHFAVETGQKDVVEQLIAKGVEINVMDGRADNALSLAKKNNQKEITDLLVKNGAQDPDPSELLGDRRYYSPGAGQNPNFRRMPQPAVRTGNINQTTVEVDLLADPNEIKTRVKTFDGLEMSLKEVSEKNQNESRQWLQTRYDNRTTLLRAVDKQFDDEIEFVKKVAVGESAKKTVEAIDSLRAARRKRSLKVSRELLQQKRAQQQTVSASTRGRGRTTGRSIRGRTSMRGQASGTNTTGAVYGRGTVNTPEGAALQSMGRPAEQLDQQTQEQMRLWVQTNPGDKLQLARALHPQIQAEFSSIRTIAVEEKAKKTTAAIDGMLLARKERFDELVKKMEQERIKLQEAQSMYNRANDPGQAYQQGGQYGGRTRRGTSTQGRNQQQSTRRTRRR